MSFESSKTWPKLRLDVVGVHYLLTFASFFFGASRFAYVGFMVHELYPYLETSEVGYYAGLLTGAYHLGQAVNGVPIGHIGDKIGVLPCLAVSAVSGIIFPIFFGLATSFWVACAVSFVYGLLNGTLPLVKVRLHDALPADESQYALSYISTCWGVASIIAPFAGGFLSYPAQKYDWLDWGLLRSFPFIIPNVICAFMNLIAVVTLFVQWKDQRATDKHAPHEDVPGFIDYLRHNNTQVVLVTAMYGLLGSLHVITAEIFPLFLMLDRGHGGFGLDTDGVAVQGLIQGVFVIVASYVTPIITSRVGFCRSLWTSVLLTIPLFIVLPFSPALPGWWGLALAAFTMGMGRQVLGQIGFNASLVLINYCCSRAYLARVNGLGATSTSICRFLPPAAASAIFAWSSTQGTVYPFNVHFIFYCYLIVAVVVAYAGRQLRPERDRPEHLSGGTTNITAATQKDTLPVDDNDDTETEGAELQSITSAAVPSSSVCLQFNKNGDIARREEQRTVFDD
eukprot:PhM_4_TR13914/c2_g3_i1/m.40003